MNSRSNQALGNVESACDNVMMLGDLQLKHEFVPFGLRPFEVGKYTCRVCNKRMYNPKANHQRRCKYCKMMIHERCQSLVETQEFWICEARQSQLNSVRSNTDIVDEALNELEAESNDESVTINEQTTVIENTLAERTNSLHSLPLTASESSTSVVVSLSKTSHQSITHTSSKTKNDRYAHMAKYLKSEFEHRNLVSSNERSAFIQHEIERVLDLDSEDKEVDLMILQTFAMHY